MQKEFARHLDYQANLAARNSLPTASSKQIWFLAGLLAKLGEDPDVQQRDNTPLTVRVASEMIEYCLKQINEVSA